MKESLWGYYLVILGMLVCSIMILMSNMTTTNQQDYYLLKEISNAAMIDSIDYGYYRTYGETKINTEKFVENFVRRFGQSVSKNNSYKIDFYGIYENPPRVSIKVTSSTGDFAIAGNNSDVEVVNKIDVILEANNKLVYSTVSYIAPYGQCMKDNPTRDLDGYCKLSIEENLKTQINYNEVKNKLKEKAENAGLTFDENKIKILNSEFLKVMNNVDEIAEYKNSLAYSYIKGYNNLPNNGIDIEKYLADSIKDIKLTVLETPTKEKIISWSARYKCGETLDQEEEIRKYRLKPSVKIGTINSSTSEETRKNYLIDYNIIYKTNSSYGVYSDNLINSNYEETPYYNSCLVGIKYKIDFYYDITK